MAEGMEINMQMEGAVRQAEVVGVEETSVQAEAMAAGVGEAFTEGAKVENAQVGEKAMEFFEEVVSV